MKLTTQLEQEAVRKLKRGNKLAFTRLFYAYENRVFGYAFNLLLDKKDAEEVVQEVFYQIWKCRDRIDETKSFKSFLFTICKRLIYKAIRSRTKKLIFQQQAENENVGWNQTEEMYQYHELESTIHKIVDSMSLKRRQVFIMSRFQGLTNQEIANQLDISLSTVENHMNKALGLLRKELTLYDAQFLFFALIFLT